MIRKYYYLNFSFSHLTLLLPLHEPEKRAFYKRHCVMSNWSVEELKRQINTLYYERSGMSPDPGAGDRPEPGFGRICGCGQRYAIVR
ncbi:DUF1016 N-terminal domain-containing protein [Dyadobacter sp. 676]|uniref:DUF1016 N-terminal domain-containing protein n=1 Tax=Dyadobacter sp. 676 TaxID=3088362 RepID=A0AAU8FSF7_9BACT